MIQVTPYLLRGLAIYRPNQVWATNLTYIPMARGFVYLVAVMDWYSRRVLSWRVSNTLDASFCVDTLEETIENHGIREILTQTMAASLPARISPVFSSAKVFVSAWMAKSRWLDTVFVEPQWRSVKYEEVYLRAYDDIMTAHRSLGRYFEFYNSECRHLALDWRTPDSVYYEPAAQLTA